MKRSFSRDERWPDWYHTQNVNWADIEVEMTDEEFNHFVSISEEYNRLQKIITKAYDAKIEEKYKV